MKNILFITADQLRYDALGHMGVFPVRTPVIDRLAAEGTRFENAYCSNPLCVPARASIMTGKYCCDTGVYYNDQGWGEALDTIPRALGRNGYYTVACGKMHFNPAAAHRGFDKRMADNGLDYPRYLAARGLAVHRPDRPGNDGTPHSDAGIHYEMRLEESHLPLEDYVTVYTSNEAIGELRRIRARRDCTPLGNEPFFMWLSYIKPHSPCDPPAPYNSLYDPDDLPPPVRGENETGGYCKEKVWYKSHWDVLSEEDIRKFRARYLGNVTLLDEQIGRVLAELEALGIADNTLIVFSSDHGEHMGDHGFMQKSFFYDCSAKVPFIFKGPGVAAGRAVPQMVSHIDLLPTLLDDCRLTQPYIEDGTGRPVYGESDFGDARSLLPALREDGALSDSRVILSESGVHGLHVMARRGGLKVNYYYDSQRVELFDLAADPDELDDQGAGMTLDDVPADLRAALHEILRRAGRYHGRPYTFGPHIWRMFS
ncbi:MAG: sulfatase-like hydrolase/transferase [Lentisphaerae bacterium]|nr:sulfatase-like hydrolase/transferase [Lentisphaerota bacterium]